MEFKQLEYFKEIADTGSINEAAKRLHMSQPPLSYQIRQLEKELGVRLFDRTKKGVLLTDAGTLLYAHAEKILSYVHSASIEVSNAGKNRILRIGITPTTVTVMMPYLSQFSRENPDARFEVHDGSTFTLTGLVMDDIIEASAVRTPVNLDGLEHIELLDDHMISVSAEAEAKERLALEDLMGRPLILYRRYEKFITDAFWARSLSPDIFCICDDARDALLWVRENLATAIFPASMSPLCGGLCVRPISEPELETKILLVWKKERRPSDALRSFLKICASNPQARHTAAISPSSSPA